MPARCGGSHLHSRRGTRQEGYWEFEARLGYTVRSKRIRNGMEGREGKGREGKKLITAVDNLGNQENWTFKTSLSYIIQAISDA